MNLEKTMSSNDLNSLKPNNINEFESIKEYLNIQPEEINKLNDISKTFISIINNLIEYTKNYSSQIEFLALKIVPNYTIEGHLMQSFQALLLFFSEGLNSLIKELRNNINIKHEENISKILEQFKLYKKEYYQKIKEANNSHKNFKKEFNLYQEFLVNNEFKEHKKKGNISNNIYDDSIYIKESDDNNITEENQFDYLLNEKDNKSELIKSNKEYIKNINESNDLLNNIRQFLSQEKTNIIKNIYNLNKYFVNGLVNYSKHINKSFETQIEVLNKLTNRLIHKEKNQTILTDFTIKLKYLEIYHQNVLEKKNLNNKENSTNKNSGINNNNINNQNETNKKIKKKENNKKNNKRNDVLSLEYINTEHKNDLNLLDRKTLNLSSKQLDNNSDIGRKTFNPNQIRSNSTEEEKEEIFQSQVKKLNRDEIINIYEKIKDTNISLNAADIKLIETEKNYKKIKEILIILFIHPEKYVEEHKNSLINLLEEDKKYILYFIKVLNDHRTKGNCFLSEFTFKYFGEVFQFLNNYILRNNYMEIFKYILILSQTYCYYSKENKKKVYLFSFIKDYAGYTNPQFWEDYLKELIKHDLKNINKTDLDLNNINLEKSKKDEKEKLVNCFFSNLLTTSKAMADFNLDKNFVREFVEKNKNKYYLSQEQIDNICLLYEMSINEEQNISNKEDKLSELENQIEKEKIKNNKLEEDKTKEDIIDDNHNNDNINNENKIELEKDKENNINDDLKS